MKARLEIHPFRNAKGFSLVEAVLMVGLTLMITTGAATLVTNMVKDYQLQRAHKTAKQLTQEIGAHLANPAACLSTIGPILLDSSTNATITNIRDSGGIATHTVTHEFANGAIKLIDMRAYEYADTVPPAGTLKLLLQFENPKRPGSGNIARVINLITRKDGANLLVSCSPEGVGATGTSGPWTPTSGSIYTSTNVGIGTTTPAAKLDVKGGKIKAQLDCRVVVGNTLAEDPSIAACDADEYVISGGGNCTAVDYDNHGMGLHESRPLPDLSGWAVDCFSLNPDMPGRGGVLGTARAICCKK